MLPSMQPEKTNVFNYSVKSTLIAELFHDQLLQPCQLKEAQFPPSYI